MHVISLIEEMVSFDGGFKIKGFLVSFQILVTYNQFHPL